MSFLFKSKSKTPSDLVKSLKESLAKLDATASSSLGWASQASSTFIFGSSFLNLSPDEKKSYDKASLSSDSALRRIFS